MLLLRDWILYCLSNLQIYLSCFQCRILMNSNELHQMLSQLTQVKQTLVFAWLLHKTDIIVNFAETRYVLQVFNVDRRLYIDLPKWNWMNYTKCWFSCKLIKHMDHFWVKKLYLFFDDLYKCSQIRDELYTKVFLQSCKSLILIFDYFICFMTFSKRTDIKGKRRRWNLMALNLYFLCPSGFQCRDSMNFTKYWFNCIDPSKTNTWIIFEATKCIFILILYLHELLLKTETIEWK